MDDELINNDNEINNIFDNIKDLVINSRNKVYQTVNTEMLSLYWNIGKAIMEIQQGDERASYGDSVLEKLSQKLTNEFGKGFSSRNLRTMRKFYLIYPIWKTVSAKLSWYHYLELIKIDEEPKRNFYLNECINSKWSVRELQRQRDSLLYERLTLSADKEKILELSEKGQMQMYVNYYDREIKQDYENSTVGILLSTNKNETVVKYTLPEDNKTIFSSEYKLHMPTEQELITAIEEEKKNFKLNEKE